MSWLEPEYWKHHKLKLSGDWKHIFFHKILIHNIYFFGPSMSVKLVTSEQLLWWWECNNLVNSNSPDLPPPHPHNSTSQSAALVLTIASVVRIHDYLMRVADWIRREDATYSWGKSLNKQTFTLNDSYNSSLRWFS